MKKFNQRSVKHFATLSFIPSSWRNVARIAILLFTLSSFAIVKPQKASAQISVSFQLFYDDLSPYGNWVDNSDYGYVWVPRVERDFRPYSSKGHWVYAEVGWTWVSDYDWGWAPFHYGRWFNDPYYGWVWVPDSEWGPGWVSWRSTDDYYGWEPIAPGISIEFAYSSGYVLPYEQWTFVRNRDFGRPDIYNYYVNPTTTSYVSIVNQSTVINNIQIDNSRNVRYSAGPERVEVERRAGKQFQPVAIRESSRPGQNLRGNNLEIYRPVVQRESVNGSNKRIAPSKVDTWKGRTPATQRAQEDRTNNDRRGNNMPQQTQQSTDQRNKQGQQQQQQREQQQRAQQQKEQQQRGQQQQQQKEQQQRAQQQKEQQQRGQQQKEQQQRAQQQKEQQQRAQQQKEQQQRAQQQKDQQQRAQQQKEQQQRGQQQQQQKEQQQRAQQQKEQQQRGQQQQQQKEQQQRAQQQKEQQQKAPQQRPQQQPQQQKAPPDQKQQGPPAQKGNGKKGGN